MKANEIINRVKEIKRCWRTNDPYEIAKKLGIAVVFEEAPTYDYTAHILKMSGYPTTILINDKYTDFSKKVLCAHELGHALLHDGINHFKTTPGSCGSDVEYEANLFTVALLSDDFSQKNFAIPLSEMNNYILRAIIEYNLSEK